MSTTDNPVFEPARTIAGPEVTVPAVIWVTGRYMENRKSIISFEELVLLKGKVRGWIICPEKYCFLDTPETRRLLGIEPSQEVKA